MPLAHTKLKKSLKKAYSAERATAFAYVGHASSLTDPDERSEVKQIERDEWNHRKHVKRIMDEYQIAPSTIYEIRFFLIGKFIGLSCHVIGRFMPFFFAGKLESGNVCEYFIMRQYFNETGISKHDAILHQMGIKEKEHEVYFANMIAAEAWLPWFERIFGWGPSRSQNDVDLDQELPVDSSGNYCRPPKLSPRRQ